MLTKNTSLFIYFITFLHFLVASKDYGKFSVQVNDLDLCKGPKRRDCCDVKAKMLNNVDLSYDIVIKEDVIPTRGKIFASINGKSVIRLQMKKPCDHLFIKPLFQALLNVSDDCIFRRGEQHINVNLDTVAQQYYGGMFLYGNMTFKSLFYNENCNFSCTVVQVEILPKVHQKSVSLYFVAKLTFLFISYIIINFATMSTAKQQ